MGLDFSAAATHYADLDDGIDNENTFSLLVWAQCSAVAGRLLLGKGGFIKYCEGTTGSNLRFVVRRATTNSQAWSTGGVYTLDEPFCVCATYDVANGCRMYIRTLTTPFAEVAYNTQAVGAGAILDDSGASWRFGATEAPGFGWIGHQYMAHHLTRRLTDTSEMDELAMQMELDPDTSFLIHMGLSGATAEDVSPAGRAVTVVGATQSPHIPMPVDASLDAGWESRGLVQAELVTASESMLPVGLDHLTEWEWLEPVHRELEQRYEFLSARSQQLLTPEEHLGAPQRLNVTPWESGGEGGAVEASQACGWESLTGVEKSAVHAHESLYTWPWGEKTVRRVALFVLASEQVPGQTVVSRIGPNGWLGNSPADAVDDPTLDQNAPERWVMGQTPKRYVNWGDVLGDVFSSPLGFTVAVPFEASSMNGMEDPMLFQKNIPSSLQKGVQLSVTGDGRLNVTVVYGASYAELDNISSVDIGAVTVGKHVAAMHFDPAQPRYTLRNQAWLNGDALAMGTNFGAGNDEGIAIDSSGSPLLLGSAVGGFRETPESVHAFIVAEGVLEPETHANMAQWFRDGGWEMPAEASAAHPWESEAAIDSEAAVAIEELLGVGAENLMPWESRGVFLGLSRLEFDVYAGPALEASMHATPAMDAEARTFPALEGQVHANPRRGA